MGVKPYIVIKLTATLNVTKGGKAWFWYHTLASNTNPNDETT